MIFKILAWEEMQSQTRIGKLEEKLQKLTMKKETPKKRKSAGPRDKVHKVMKEFKGGKLHSGSKKGPTVTNPKQAIAIGLSEARKKGAHIPSRK
jgi:hypothetical protein